MLPVALRDAIVVCVSNVSFASLDAYLSTEVPNRLSVFVDKVKLFYAHDTYGESLSEW